MTSRDWVFWEECSPPPTWAVVLLWGCVLAGVVPGVAALLRGLATGDPGAVMGGAALAASVFAIGPLFHLFFGRMRVVVSRTSVTVSFGWTRLLQKLVTFDEIESVEAVRYSPLREFGGWGIRWGRGGRKAWTMRGDGAVVLGLADGTRLYVGSDRPHLLSDRIHAAMRARPGGPDGGAEPEIEATDTETS